MGLSNAERQARWQKKRNAEIAALRARVVALEAHAGADGAAAAAGRIAALERELTAARAEIAALKDELHATLTARFAPKPRAAKPKVEKPPLPPDEERERIIKGLKTRVRNLTIELQVTRRWRDAVRQGDIAFSFATRSKIMKPLHPDTRKQATEADLDEACKAFTAWLDDLKPRRR